MKHLLAANLNNTCICTGTRLRFLCQGHAILSYLFKAMLGCGLLLLSALSHAQTSQVYYIHTDHLNTPRLLTDSQGRERWRWEQGEGFGSNAPNEQPTATQPKVTFNLRYPGQYFDAETATHYNYFRDYNPQTGRYTTSDPIGLRGGINTYTYVENQPLKKIDPTGENAVVIGIGEIFFGGMLVLMTSPDGQQIIKDVANKIIQACKKGPDCDTQEIEELAGDLRKRYVQMVADVDNLFCERPTGKFSWSGHKAKFYSDQRYLKNKIQAAKANGCPVSPEAEYIANIEAPSCPAR